MATRERPILFSGEMVRAILEGRKTQTRRVIRPQPSETEAGAMGERYFRWEHPRLDAGYCHTTRPAMERLMLSVCPYGSVGCRLWVRERHWCRPSIPIPRWASRLTLEVTDVRVERVQDISEADAEAEGVDAIPRAPAALTHRTAFAGLWDKINSSRGYGWGTNPWVWVVEFRRVEQ